MIHSVERLEGVDPRLSGVVRAVAAVECVVVCGVRDKRAQDQAFLDGKTKVMWPGSKHNVNSSVRAMSEAVDLCPWPIDWKNLRQFDFLAGAVMQEAKRQGVSVRWGGDWSADGIGDAKDNRFQDLGHFELVTS